MSDIIEVTDQSFDAEVLKSDVPVLLDFWAPWCGPCKMMTPLLEKVAVSFDGKAKICKMNVDDNKEMPVKYGVRGIPTLVFFKNGQLEATQVGALSQTQLEEFINTNI